LGRDIEVDQSFGDGSSLWFRLARGGYNCSCCNKERKSQSATDGQAEGLLRNSTWPQLVPCPPQHHLRTPVQSTLAAIAPEDPDGWPANVKNFCDSANSDGARHRAADANDPTLRFHDTGV
jgi:hypothetical protein